MAEVAALRLYSGPLFEKYNGVLRGLDSDVPFLANTMVTLEVHDTIDADAIGGNPIMLANGEDIGRVTSGGYGFRVNKSLALAMVRPHLAAVGTELMIDILDQRLPATVVTESPYDPRNEKLRA